MFLIGDSHTRSYGTSDFLSPVFFLTSGKRINLSGFVPFARLLYYCFVAGRSARKNSDTYAIIVGEADLRRLQYNDWKLHEGRITVPTSHDLRYFGMRLKMLITFLAVFDLCPALIIGVGTPNLRLKKGANDLNDVFEKISKSKKIMFFNPMHILNNCEPSQAEKYVGFSVFNRTEIDQVHLSGLIAKDLDAFLETSGLNRGKRKTPERYFKSARYISEFGVHKL